MRKRLWAILVAGALAWLGGCAAPPTAQPSSTVSTAPADSTYRITYQWTMLSNNSVGNDWHQSVTCNGRTIRNGDTVNADPNGRITVCGAVTEDDKYPDSGRGTLELTLTDGAWGCVRITVREDRGQYAGNTALWELSCRVAREE